MLLYAAGLDAFGYMARAGRRKNVRHGKWVKGNNFNKAQEKQEEHKLQEIWGKDQETKPKNLCNKRRWDIN